MGIQPTAGQILTRRELDLGFVKFFRVLHFFPGMVTADYRLVVGIE
jgi:hypothetical protein